MSQYLSKEEIKKWRSSLEKITLEEYARRLGKTIEEEKHTSDIIDIVMQNEKRVYTTRESSQTKEVLKIARKSQDIQNKIMKQQETKSVGPLDEIKSRLTCKKPLTQREDTVLEHFIKNKGQIVYAKDLAVILNLPTDYVYKYIKNLRAKISENILQNAVKGGYVFDVQ